MTHSLYFHCFRQGLHDSICRACFMTVSSQTSEIDLVKDEERHVCTLEHPWLRRDVLEPPLNRCELS